MPILITSLWCTSQDDVESLETKCQPTFPEVTPWDDFSIQGSVTANINEVSQGLGQSAPQIVLSECHAKNVSELIMNNFLWKYCNIAQRPILISSLNSMSQIDVKSSETTSQPTVPVTRGGFRCQLPLSEVPENLTEEQCSPAVCERVSV